MQLLAFMLKTVSLPRKLCRIDLIAGSFKDNRSKNHSSGYDFNEVLLGFASI